VWGHKFVPVDKGSLIVRCHPKLGLPINKLHQIEDFLLLSNVEKATLGLRKPTAQSKVVRYSSTYRFPSALSRHGCGSVDRLPETILRPNSHRSLRIEADIGGRLLLSRSTPAEGLEQSENAANGSVTDTVAGHVQECS
jgi:hypothetical protein